MENDFEGTMHDMPEEEEKDKDEDEEEEEKEEEEIEKVRNIVFGGKLMFFLGNGRDKSR